MRLIKCSTLTFEEFTGSSIPLYGILSHTWRAHELSFTDLGVSSNLDGKRGSKKILKLCQLALRDHYEYAWCDSVCIDKTSSAELTEAINSMYKWYARSGRCYVYLGDFDCAKAGSDFAKCRWFSRGWTLQELIAPQDVQFYDRKWRYFGSKAELCVALSTITGIEKPILNGEYPLHLISVAKRMSWASGRQTTREEDLAYCLLGIFGISMPLLYGEGVRAFMRLQEEIMKETNDLTLFAWQAQPNDSASLYYRGALAYSPKEFVNAGSISSIANPKTNPEFAMTNKGLKIQVALIRNKDNTVFMPLNCRSHAQGHDTIGIYLVDVGGGVFARELPHKLATQVVDEYFKTKLIYITKDVKDARYL